MKTVRDHKNWRTCLPDLDISAMIVVHETTEQFTTENVSGTAIVNTKAALIPISHEMLDDIAPVGAFLHDALTAFTRMWTTSEAVELAPSVTRDDAAMALWQAKNKIDEQKQRIRELEEKVERMQATAQSIFGSESAYDIAELLGIPTEW